MASIFTYDPDPPRVSSPWSASGTSTPQVLAAGGRGLSIRTRSGSALVDLADADVLSDYGISKLEPEPQEGPTEYKVASAAPPASALHLHVNRRRGSGLIPRTCSAGTILAVAIHRPDGGCYAQAYAGEVGPEPPATAAGADNATSMAAATIVAFSLVCGGGALYEIGVADDGSFVGLVQDELDESVMNLQAMAASLGCKVEILRRVIVGECEWADGTLSETEPASAQPDSLVTHKGTLWVAEALVTPDLDYYNLSPSRTRGDDKGKDAADSGANKIFEEDYSHTEQIRISIAGPSTAGKSSLLGTLTSSQLDNGRGKSRLSLLKHRHEISSGITSSVAQELIGYAEDNPPSVVNYASGNVAAWNDIHAASQGGRLAFVSDLPGSVRYLKSTIRGLVSWAPHYVLLCVPANCGDETAEGEGAPEHNEIDLCLAYLELCLKLEIPVLIAVTKLDVASRGGLRDNLARVLSALKATKRKPLMLPASPAGDKTLDLQRISAADSKEVQKMIATADVPSMAQGLGGFTHVSDISQFHVAHVNGPPQLPKSLSVHAERPSNIFDVDEVFAIPPSKAHSKTVDKNGQESRGMVLCGLVRHGNNTHDHAPLSLLSRSSGPGPSAEFPASFIQGLLGGKEASCIQAKWQRVRVVSVRDLRLPVRRLIEDQVGTIGVELLASPEDGKLPRLSRIRKGMVLTNLHASLPPPDQIPPTVPLPFHTGFSATFSASEFASPRSPPLLLGGNAIAYIANIRTTVRVVSMALTGAGDEPPSPPSPTEPEFFSFDGESESPGRGAGAPTQSPRLRPAATDISRVVSGTSHSAGDFQEDVTINFALVTSVEWIEVGSQVLVMPGASMAAPSAVAGASGSGAVPGVALSGLEGFVGTVSEVARRNAGGEA
ncbi:hypothetical protein N7470_004376 [Penicillium chermesinum]|nr:hypothetical protein N7470_004376 [Penicillium chermesinum]